MRKRSLLGGSIPAILLAAGMSHATDLTQADNLLGVDLGKVAIEGMDHPDRIPGSFIVVLNEDMMGTQSSKDLARTLAKDSGFQVSQTYSTALSGFAITAGDALMASTEQSTQRALAVIAQDPRVDFIEADRRVYLNQSQSPATWGLDRIDQRDLPLDNTYQYQTTASGVNAYILDTGIRSSHAEFGNRVQGGWTAINDGRGTEDCNGHGTHVAGTVGGEVYGVAKAATLVPVRVLGCQGSGSNAGVIGGVDFVANNHQAPAVANMSLGGGASNALDNAVNGAASAGVTMVTASGNSSTNACNSSPGRAAGAFNVGSTTSNDSRSNFSNYGSCVDIWAPGSNITAAWHTSYSATNTISGTSMAAPHVAGVAALYLGMNPSASRQQVEAALIDNATTGRLSGIGSGSPNRLLYSLFGGNGGGDPGPDPGACPSGYEEYEGTLSGGRGASTHEPDGTYYQSAAGNQNGILVSPDNAIFDLYLQRWSGSAWQDVASSLPNSGTEAAEISYNGSSGFYAWRLEIWSGSGDYTFCMDTP
ncbi:subtilisin family serine protease [Natronospira proteinivora]|uniref:Subtilisin family serine protease n=1 Tax=Natronospira proteinivora TaxID=1807133 RepID=A0ABT1GAF7_9GAMM|nr:S8 family peptidase [Natronospira proteinivora]MCP1728037.1 subtilisin family serine protease [Natronospira proteinivora]